MRAYPPSRAGFGFSRRALLGTGVRSVLPLTTAGLLACHHERAPGNAGTNRGQSPTWFDVRSFGSRGDGVTKDTAALQAAIDACAAAGGGTVVLPAGTYLSAPLVLRSHLTLHLEAGATLLASTELNDYPKEPNAWSGESERAGLLTGYGVENVSIVGRGTVDGRGYRFVTNDLSYIGKDFDPEVTRQGSAFGTPPPGGFPHGPYRRGERPGNLVRFGRCRNVLIEGVTIANSPTWTMQFFQCQDVRVSGININSVASDRRVPNDDGMDIQECRGVRIEGCYIDTGDDCIALFGSEDVTVSTCVLHSRSAGVRVGYEGQDTRHCTFENLIIRGANRGLTVFARGGGSVEHVRFANITIETQLYTGRWWGKGEPIHISTLPHDPNAPRLGRIRNVSFSHINAVGEAGVVLRGCPESVLEDIGFDNLALHIRRGPLQETYGGNFDLRSSADPKLAIFKHDIPAIYAGYIEGLRLHDVRVSWDDNLPTFYTHALEVESFKGALVDGFEGRQAQRGTGGAVILLRNGEGATIRNSRATEGSDVFLETQAVAKAPLLSGNDTSLARRR